MAARGSQTPVSPWFPQESGLPGSASRAVSESGAGVSPEPVAAWLETLVHKVSTEGYSGGNLPPGQTSSPCMVMKGPSLPSQSPPVLGTSLAMSAHTHRIEAEPRALPPEPRC